MASLYREVVLKEKPVVAENGFIPLGALGKPNGVKPLTTEGTESHRETPELAEPVAGD